MKPLKTEFKFALILLAVQLVWLWLEYVSGLQTIHKDQHPILSMLVVVPSIAVIARGIWTRKKEMGGVITYRQAFLAGVLITFITSMLMPAVVLIFDKLINPNFFTDFQNYAVEKKMMSMENAKGYFNLKSYMIQSAMGTMVMGTMISAVAALMLRSRTRMKE